MKKRRGWSGILILLLLLLCACGGEQESDISRSEESEISRPDTSRPAEESRSEEEPSAGGELALAVVNPNSLNPLLCMEEEAQQMLRLIFSPLLDKDAEGQAQPALAQSWQKEGNKLTLQLNPAAVYHDGTKVTAADVVYSIRIIQEAEASPYKACVANLTDARALSENTVVLTYREGTRGPETQLYFPVLSRAYYTKNQSQTDLTVTPMGSGMYRVTSYRRSMELVLERFDRYWGTKPYIDRVTVYLTRVHASVEEAFAQGETDLYYREDTPWGLYENRTDLTLHGYYAAEPFRLVFQTTGYFAEEKNSRGAALCLNTEELLRDVYWGHGKLANQFGMAAGAAQTLTFNREEGMAQLATPPDQPLVLAYPAGDSFLKGCAEAIAEQWKQAGLAIEVQEQTAVPSTADTESVPAAQEEKSSWDIWLQRGETDLPQGTVYELFYPEKAVMTGRRIGGRLNPTPFNRYAGFEQLFIKEAER